MHPSPRPHPQPRSHLADPAGPRSRAEGEAMRCAKSQSFVKKAAGPGGLCGKAKNHRFCKGGQNFTLKNTLFYKVASKRCAEETGLV